MSDDVLDERSGSNEQDERAKMQTRRDFLSNSMIAAVGLGIGCGTDPSGLLERDSASLDGGMSDTGAATSLDGGFDGFTTPVEGPESVTESASLFPLGVATGDVTRTSAIFWTSYLGTSPLELVVWEMEGEAYRRTVHAGPVVPADAGYVHVDVPTLLPGQRHRFTFFEKDGETRVSRSPIGAVRAAIDDDAMEPLRIGAVSCVSNERAIPTIGHAGTRDDLDAFIYLGDTSYNDGSRTLSDYRSKWAQQIGRPEFRALRGRTSVLATWDDHEFDNDWDPETFDAAVRSSAVQAFFENQPLRRDPLYPNRVWKRMRWGRTAELFVLDCRSERIPSTRMTPDARYVSSEQLEWLKEGLASSDAVFKLILNTVPITALPGLFSSWPRDRWEGYAAQREEILRFIDESALTGVLWISGDLHFGSAQRVATTGLGSNQIELLVGPGAQIPNPLVTTLSAERFDFTTAESNYGILDLDPATRRVRASWHNGAGEVIASREYELG